jgi:hypothetical protein
MTTVRIPPGAETSPSYARTAFDHALAVIRGMHSSRTDREQAVWFSQFLARRLDFDEGLAADVINVIVQRLGEYQVVFYLLRVLREQHRHADALARAVARVCERAYQDDLLWSLRAAVAVAVEVPAWRRALQDDWVQRVIIERLAAGREYPALMMLTEYLKGRDSVPDWASFLVRQHPALLGDDDVLSPVRWRLHVAAPTEQGWRLLAASVQERDHSVTASAFGPSLGVAIDTLDRAIGQEPDEATRVVLAQWLARLA